MNVAVVILNWNGSAYLRQFLASVEAQSGNAQVIVADNGSTDDSLTYLRDHHPDVMVLTSDTNHGFAKGYNVALRRVEADHYILLNSDVEVTPGWIDPLIGALTDGSGMVAVQPKILAHHDQTLFEHAGAAGGHIDKLGYPFCRGRIFNKVEIDHGQYDHDTEIFWATGACLAIRSDIFHAFGGFDEDYFAHMEEIDLCWRLKNAGHRIGYVAGSTVYHVGGGALDYQSPFKTYLNFRNSLFTLVKNERDGVWIKVLQRLLLDGVAAAKFLIDGKTSHMLEVLYAHLSMYTSLKQLLHKRRIEKKRWTKMNRTGIYNGSIVSDHFFLGRVNSFTDIPADRID